MNKIYKTIRNIFTGQTTAVSEHAPSGGTGRPSGSQKTGKARVFRRLPPPALTLLTALGTAALCSSALAQHTQGGQNLVISGGIITHDVAGNGVSGTGEILPGVVYDAAHDNSVSISGGEVGGQVTGGFAASPTGSVSATGNSVSISGGEVGGQVTGGFAASPTGSVSATGNSVTISGGEVRGQVTGGFAASPTGSVSATGNSVTISGGEVATGRGVAGGYASSNSGDAIATGNSVTISGGTVGGGVWRLCFQHHRQLCGHQQYGYYQQQP